MTNSHNRTSAVATASSGRNSGDRYAHGTNLNTSSSNHQNHNNHQHNNNTNSNSQHHQIQQSNQSTNNHHSNSIATLFGNSDGNNNNGSNKKTYFGGSGGGGGGCFSNRKLSHLRNNPGGWQRTPILNASRCAGGNNLLPSSTNRVESRTAGHSSNGRYHHGKTAGNHHVHHLSSSHGRTNGIQILMNGFNRRGTSPPTLLPTSLTHFASSKCFDAPAPTALPKPPQHWTTTTSSQSGSANNCDRNNFLSGRVNRDNKPSAKRNLIDEFDTHNLKMLLNVQS